MRHGAAVSFRFSFSVAEGVVWARRVAAKEVERQHHRGRGVTEFVTLESAVWRTDPALSRNLKPPPLGGGVFTELRCAPIDGARAVRATGSNRFVGAAIERAGGTVHLTRCRYARARGRAAAITGDRAARPARAGGVVLRRWPAPAFPLVEING